MLLILLQESNVNGFIVQSDMKHQKRINVFKVVLISRTTVVIRAPLIIQHTPGYTQNVLGRNEAQKTGQYYSQEAQMKDLKSLPVV